MTSIRFFSGKVTSDWGCETRSLNLAPSSLKTRWQDRPILSPVLSVETGERIFRLLKFLRDQGNDFELSASYVYYEYTLEEPEDDDDDDDMKSTGDDYSDHNIGEFYINLGYGRGMI